MWQFVYSHQKHTELQGARMIAKFIIIYFSPSNILILGRFFSFLLSHIFDEVFKPKRITETFRVLINKSFSKMYYQEKTIPLKFVSFSLKKEYKAKKTFVYAYKDAKCINFSYFPCIVPSRISNVQLFWNMMRMQRKW